jgi:hypothetical protein
MFFKKKKDEIIDLRQLRKNINYNNSRINTSSLKEPINNTKTEDSNNFDFLGNLASSDMFSNQNNFKETENDYNKDYIYLKDNYIENSNESHEEKRKKLAKRLLDMTNKIEDLSNQIYHLTQRMEVIEKKLKLNFE